MEVFEINPHIRYCQKLTKPHGAHEVCACDCRIFYLLSGVCVFTVEDHAYSLKGNDLIYIPSGVPYRLDWDEKAAPIEMLSVNFDFDQGHRHLNKPLQTRPPQELDDAEWIRVPEGLPWGSPICIGNFTDVQTLLFETEKEIARGNIFGREYASSLLRQVLLEILRGKDRIANTEESLSQRIRQYLNRHYAEDVTAEVLGVRFGYHPYHLNRIFKKQIGTTLRRYLIDQRIRAAKNLLLVTELSVGEVAAAVGIPEQAYFSYCFKKCVGTSPREYREQKGIRYL